MQLRSRARAHAHHDATLSDDDDGDEVSWQRIPSPEMAHARLNQLPAGGEDQSVEASPLLRHISGFAPAEATESHVPAGPMRSERHRTSQAVPPSVRVRGEADPALLALEQSIRQRQQQQQRVPGSRQQASRDLLGWRRIEVASELALRNEPWYQFAELVAGNAGVRLEELVRVELPEPRRVPPIAPLPGPVVYVPQPAADPGPIDEDEEESPVLARPVVPDNLPPAPEPSTPQRRAVPRRPASVPAPDSPARRPLFTDVPPMPSMASQASLARQPTSASAGDALRNLQAELEQLLDNPAGITPAAVRKIDQTQHLIDRLQNVEQQRRSAAKEATMPVVAYLSPALVAAERVGRDMLAAQYPRMLQQVTVAELEASEAAAGAFSLLVASLVSRSFFTGGRRPLRASDYGRYAEGAAYAMTQFRYARYHGPNAPLRRRITLDYNAMARQRDRSAALAPWCTESYTYPGGSRDYTPGSGFGSSLKAALTSLPGFGPLAGPAAQRSPYGFGGTGP